MGPMAVTAVTAVTCRDVTAMIAWLPHLIGSLTEVPQFRPQSAERCLARLNLRLVITV